MKLLLDSHIVFWWVGAAPELKAAHRRAIEAAEEVFVSAVTLYELGFKANLGKLEVAAAFMAELPRALREAGFTPLAISAEHARVAAALTLHHRDPFDRLLAAQCLSERLTLVTTDPVFKRYRVPLLA